MTAVKIKRTNMHRANKHHKQYDPDSDKIINNLRSFG